MSVALDTNILLYAVNSAAQEHGRARSFLEELVASQELIYLPWPVLFSFMRIATHPGVFPRPLSYAAVRERIGELLALENVRVLGEEEGFWGIFTEVSDNVRPTGNLLPDAHIAAILRQNGVRTLYTNDADFRRFAFLRVLSPFTDR